MKKDRKNKARFNKTILILLLVCLCLGAVPFIINGVVIFSARKYYISANEAAQKNADCVLVLGARVMPDGSPSPILEDRIIKGIDVYDLGVADRILMSGGHDKDEDYDEPIAMKNYAIKSSVPAEHIIMDNRGYSTYESLYRAKEIYGAEKLIVVTQKYHLYRSIYIGRQLGLEVYGVDSDLREYKSRHYNNLREFFARCKDFIFCIIKPEPNFMGDPVSIK